MKISIIGTGYVGLVTGTCLAEKGNQVICVDNDLKKLEKLNLAQIPIYEPGLSELVKKNHDSKNLTFTDNLEYAVTNSDIIFFCLPTPTLEDGTSDTKYIFQVSQQIGKHFTSPKIIINKSTVPIGTTEKIEGILAEDTSIPFSVVSNPEFLREGFAVEDFMNPDRIVIGLKNTNSADAKTLTELYRPFVKDIQQIQIMDPRSSEMSKYAANAFLALKITFINEVANLCEKLGANVDSVRNSMGMDPRIGNRFLNPGIGYGGSCFPKDVKALNFTSQKAGYNFQLLDTTMQVNEKQIDRFVEKVTSVVEEGGLEKNIALWGLTFKANTDDLRESPALKIAKKLIDLDYKITAYDPKGMENFKEFYSELQLELASDMYSCVQEKSLLIVATEWEEFKLADLEKVRSLLAKPIILDGRNIFNLADMDRNKFRYISIGRG